MPTQLDYLKCFNRTPGHQWDELGAPVRRRRAGSWGNLTDYRCVRCVSLKHVLTNSIGENVTWYEYSKGYETFKNNIEVHGNDLRLELISELKREYTITTKSAKKKIDTSAKVIPIKRRTG